MKQLVRILVIMPLIAITTSLNAQTQSDSSNWLSPGTFLRLSHSPINNSHKDDFGFDLNLDWEVPIAPRWTVNVSLYKDFSARGGLRPDVYSGVRDLFTGAIYQGEGHDIRASLGLGLNYYFKPNTYGGWYASFKLNNALVLSDKMDTEGGRLAIRDPAALGSLPAAGLYLGYRKVFKNNFFIDAQVGYLIQPEYRQVRYQTFQPVDMKIGIGYQIKIPKRKKKKK